MTLRYICLLVFLLLCCCCFFFKKYQICSGLTNITILILSPDQVLGKPKKRRLRHKVNLYIYIGINVVSMCELDLKNVAQGR